MVIFFLLILFASSVNAHIGDRIYLIYEISDEMLGNMDMRDGSLNDWKEVAPPSLEATDFMVAPDVGEGTPYKAADMDYQIWLGWNGASSRLYFGMERQDDIYVNEYAGGNLGDTWKYDSSVVFLVDGDHSGGDVNGPPGLLDEEQALNLNRMAQQYMMIADAPDQHYLGYRGLGEWVTMPPFAEGSGFSQGQSPTVSTLEFYVTPFDDLIWNSPEHSVPSQLFPGKIVGFEISIPDFDTQPGEYHAFHTLSGGADTWNRADHFVDGRLVVDGLGSLERDGDGETHVTSNTWGRIKASFAR